MIAIFSRTDNTYNQGTHGYSTIFVEYSNDKELKKIREIMTYSRKGPTFKEPFEHPYQWYGGNFDLSGIIDGNIISIGYDQDNINHRRSIGDNRFVGRYTAQEIFSECCPCPEYLKGTS